MKHAILALLLIVTCAATAPPKRHLRLNSLGISIQESECVVVAVITSVESFDRPDKSGENQQWHKLTLEVHETIKGAPQETLEIFISNLSYLSWTKTRTEMLLFLITGQTMARDRTAYMSEIYKDIPWTTAFPSEARCPVDLQTMRILEDFPVITDDLRMLTTRDEILSEARKAAVSTSGRTDFVTLYMPRYFGEQYRAQTDAQSPGVTGLADISDLTMRVAITDDACRAARQWAVSPDWSIRWVGASILVHQRSAENIRTLRHFVEEPPLADAQLWPLGKAHVLSVLQSWGERDLPPLPTPSPFFDATHWVAWASLAGLFLPIVIYLAWHRKRTRPLPFFFLFSVSCILTLIARSHVPLDAASWGNFDFAAERNWIYLVHHKRADAGIPAPLVFSTPENLSTFQDMDLAVRPSSMDASMFFTSPFKSFADQSKAKSRDPIWRINLWYLLAAIVLPSILKFTWNWHRTRRNVRAKGFPIEITPQHQ